MQVDVGITQEKDGTLAVTLRGEVSAVIEVLVHGLNAPALEQIRDAFEAELAGRSKKPVGILGDPEAGQ